MSRTFIVAVCSREYVSSQLNPLTTREDLNLGDGVNFPKPASCLANLVRMIGVEHQSPGNPDFGALLGKAAASL
jgi:hypothetical protein